MNASKSSIYYKKSISNNKMAICVQFFLDKYLNLIDVRVTDTS